MNSEPRPSTAKPATPIPITEPPENDTFNAVLRLVLAACAVRTLALVAIFIPIKPAKADNTAPIRKAMTITGLELPLVEPR